MYVLGKEAMARMAKANVLISGIGGLGVETAKNVILGGVRSVTLHDTEPITWEDMSAQFYGTDSHGKNRACASVDRLSELNQYVSVAAETRVLTKDFIKDFSVVIVTQEIDTNRVVQLNQWCRETGTHFIACGIRGVFGYLCNDFGDDWICIDPDGTPCASKIIESIVFHENCLRVTVVDDERHDFEDCFVRFTEIQGPLGSILNTTKEPKLFRTKGVSPYEFDIVNLDDTSLEMLSNTSYQGDGIVVNVKVPFTVDPFVPFAKAISEKNALVVNYTDFGKIHLANVNFFAFLVLSEYVKQHDGQFPRPYNNGDAAVFVDLARHFHNDHEYTFPLDEPQCRHLILFSYCCQGQLSPMAAMMGGIVAQELMKSVSGKFMPYRGLFAIDFVEALPVVVEDDKIVPLYPEESFSGQQCRYDGQLKVFGKELQEKMLPWKYFLVGAGAIGCEILKNWAMMGVGCCPDGHIHVTDMDIIERSNLNRQFLFRDGDIGSSKSDTAAKAAKVMNPDLTISAHNTRMGSESEGSFGIPFFESLDGVCNALDNVETRRYIDNLCVLSERPLLESGTTGTLGNTQIIVPFITENYGIASTDEKTIPLCTLKNFPYKIEHTIQWARDMFQGFFYNTPTDCREYSKRGAAFLASIPPTSYDATLAHLKDSLLECPLDFKGCVFWAVEKFIKEFRDAPSQLVAMYPRDAVTKKGVPFWLGHKRFPTPVTAVDVMSDDTTYEFIQSASLLRATICGVTDGIITDRKVLSDIASKIAIPDFVPSKNINIITDETVTEDSNSELSGNKECEEIEQAVARMSTFPPLSVIEFEKDDPTNHHMEFIVSAANLRARIYSISEVDAHEAKRVAGKIIPAIATTTAFVAGAICIEMYKLVQGRNDISYYRNVYANLAVSIVNVTEPEAPASNPYFNGEERTAWDVIKFSGIDKNGREMTIPEMMKQLETKYEMLITSMTAGRSLIYTDYQDEALSSKPLSKQVKAENQESKFLLLDILVDDDEVFFPKILYSYEG